MRDGFSLDNALGGLIQITAGMDSIQLGENVYLLYLFEGKLPFQKSTTERGGKTSVLTEIYLMLLSYKDWGSDPEAMGMQC